VVNPVVVVGNGPVGQTGALLLARWGVRVTVLEQRPSRELVGSKSICQQRDVLDVWDSVGARAVIAEGLTWTTARTYYRDRELFSWRFVDRGRSPLPPFVNLSQARIEQILDERIAATPAIDVRWGHEVVGLDQDANGATLTCLTPRGRATLRAPYALVCAGARGEAVRQMLGLPFAGDSFDDPFLICDIRAQLPGWASERRFYFDPAWNPGRQVLIHPCPGSMFRVDWQVPPDFDLAAEQRSGALDRRIRMVLGDRPYELLWSTVYRFHSRHVDRMRVGRVLVAGDCAHLFAPFGARGLNSGVQDVENAAWKLAFVLRGWAPEQLLDSYDRERLAAALENLEITNTTMRFLAPQSAEEWARRKEILARAVTHPDAREQVDSGRMAEPFWYVDSPLTTLDPSRPFAGRPPRGHAPSAGPGVIVPDVPVRLPDQPWVTRLRQIARDGLLVLAAAGLDPAPVAVAMKETTDVPTRVLSIADIDFEGALAAALGARPGEAWIIRPDGHVAAVLVRPTAAALGVAIRRPLGQPA
jgi:3-(3-hydroxy-phenyl)propionate hydroxylase